MNEAALTPLGHCKFAVSVGVPRIEEPTATRIGKHLADTRQYLFYGGIGLGAGKAERGQIPRDPPTLRLHSRSRPAVEAVLGDLQQEPMGDGTDLSRRFADPVELDGLSAALRFRCGRN